MTLASSESSSILWLLSEKLSTSSWMKLVTTSTSTRFNSLFSLTSLTHFWILYFLCFLYVFLCLLQTWFDINYFDILSFSIFLLQTYFDIIFLFLFFVFFFPFFIWFLPTGFFWVFFLIFSCILSIFIFSLQIYFSIKFCCIVLFS